MTGGPRTAPLKQVIPLAKFTLLIFVLLSVGCRWQVGRDGDPTPAPSPSPTPTPEPLADLSFSRDAAAVPLESSPSARVAAASAEFFEDATAQAASGTTSVRRALARAVEVPSEAASQLREAKASLSDAAEAYRKAEASVFLVDPESTAELRAQPDPLRAGTPGARDKTLADLSASLAKMDELLSRPLNQTSAALLLSEAQSAGTKIVELETGLAGMAEAWADGDEANFRRQFFLASAEGAVARVFQGALAMTGDVLPGMLAGAETNPAEISERLAAVKELYTGSPEAASDSPSLQILVQETAPVQAALTRASIARAAALAGVLEISPDNQNLRKELVSSLADVTRQLTLAAQSLGIVIVAEE